MLKSPEFNFMRRTIMKAARNLRHDFNEIEKLQTTHTGVGQFPEKSREHVKNTLIHEIDTAQKNEGIIVDDSIIKQSNATDIHWLVNPLDGFQNYAHSIGHYAIIMAKKQNDIITHACLYHPFLDKLYLAEHKKGAYVNNERLRVSTHNSTIANSCTLYNVPEYTNKHLQKAETKLHACLNNLRNHQSFLRQNGCVSLDIIAIAEAKAQIYLDCTQSSITKDIARFFVQEAGGQASIIPIENTQKNNSQNTLKKNNILFLVTNRFLHTLTSQCLK